jgi:hypothetical protein
MYLATRSRINPSSVEVWEEGTSGCMTKGRCLAHPGNPPHGAGNPTGHPYMVEVYMGAWRYWTFSIVARDLNGTMATSYTWPSGTVSDRPSVNRRY